MNLNMNITDVELFMLKCSVLPRRGALVVVSKVRLIEDEKVRINDE